MTEHIFCFRLALFSLSCNTTVFLLCGLGFLAFLLVFYFFKWLGFFSKYDSLMFYLVVFQWGTCQKLIFIGRHFCTIALQKTDFFGKFQQENSFTALSATSSQAWILYFCSFLTYTLARKLEGNLLTDCLITVLKV